MTRFEAADPTERRKLFADAVLAHRERGSPFLTIEVEPDPALDEVAGDVPDGDGEGTGRDIGADDDIGAAGNDGDDGDGDPPRHPPWLQFAEQTFNLDCTDDELDRLESLLEEFPEFRIDAMESPDEAAATNVRVSARSDANRLADFADRVFREVYRRPEDYRAWVVEI